MNAVSMALGDFGHEVRLTIEEANALDDAATADLFTEISRGIDKWLWFVEAHSQAPKWNLSSVKQTRPIKDRAMSTPIIDRDLTEQAPEA